MDTWVFLFTWFAWAGYAKHMNSGIWHYAKTGAKYLGLLLVLQSFVNLDALVIFSVLGYIALWSAWSNLLNLAFLAQGHAVWPLSSLRHLYSSRFAISLMVCSASRHLFF